MQFEESAVFSPEDNVQSGDVACVTISIVEDDILEPMVQFLVRFQINPRVTQPQDTPDFTRVFIVDTTSQGTVYTVQPVRVMLMDSDCLPIQQKLCTTRTETSIYTVVHSEFSIINTTLSFFYPDTYIHTYLCVDVVLDFQNTALSGAEGGTVSVCVTITSFPSGGVEIPVTLELGTTNGPKTCMSSLQYDIIVQILGLLLLLLSEHLSVCSGFLHVQ